MSSPSLDAVTSPVLDTAPRMHPGRSILKRALLGIFLLSVMVTGGVWLMHASIEGEADGLRDTTEISLRQ